MDINKNENNKNAENQQKKDTKITIEEGNLSIEFIGFFEKNIKITEAKKYELTLKNETFDNFTKIISGLKTIKEVKNNKINHEKNNEERDILVNGFSIKTYRIVKKYLQQNCLILKQDLFFCKKLTLSKNINIVSQMFAGYNLSDAAISSFAMKDLINKKLDNFTEEQKKMVILSYCVACPALIWIVENKLLENLSKENFEIFENAVKIRIKQGGIVIIIL